MKLYYERLSNKDKKIIKEKFLKSKDSTVYNKANKIVIASVAGILISVISVIFDYIYQMDIVNYILDGLLFIFSLIFLIIFSKNKIKEINKFAIKKTK